MILSKRLELSELPFRHLLIVTVTIFLRPLYGKLHKIMHKALSTMPAAAAKSLQVRLCVTPEMAAHQAPPSLGFSRQEHWSGLPFPSPLGESEVAQWCPTLHNPMDCSLPGSSIHGIFQARVLKWVATAFSKHNAYYTVNTTNANDSF